MDYLAQVTSPATIFLELWKIIQEITTSNLTNATPPQEAFSRSVKKILELDDAVTAYDNLRSVLLSIQKLRLVSERNGQIIAVMQCIDEIFLRIHPRSVTLSSSVARRPNIPEWLKLHRSRRFDRGFYEEIDGFRLIPRGPLMRHERHALDSGGTNLPDCFSAVGVSSSIMEHSGQKITVIQKVVGTDQLRGVTLGSQTGKELILFVPVAEDSGDIEISHQVRNKKDFLTFDLNKSVNVVDRMVGAIQKVEVIDIAIAPEFTISEENADNFATRLASIKTNKPRITVCGSGNTTGKQDGLPLNEARVINASGHTLWRQQKILQSGLSVELAKKLKIFGTSGFAFEDNASATQINIVDIEGLGRCAILICQDLKTNPLAFNLVTQFQPDWIFVPILDSGADIGRWAHTDCVELSKKSKSRFLIACSMSFGLRLDPSSSPVFGLGMGPYDDGGKGLGRLVKPVFANKFNAPDATIKWGDGTWQQTTITAI